MTKEQVVDEIKRWTPILMFSGQCTEETSEAQEMAISALKGGWIPVEERLPKEEQEVLCQLTDGSCAVLYTQDNWGQIDWVDGMMGTGTYDVEAWMELPEPYKKGE